MDNLKLLAERSPAQTHRSHHRSPHTPRHLHIVQGPRKYNEENFERRPEAIDNSHVPTGRFLSSYELTMILKPIVSS